MKVMEEAKERKEDSGGGGTSTTLEEAEIKAVDNDTRS